MNKRRALMSTLSAVGILGIGIAALLLLTSFKAQAEKVETPPAARTVRTRVLESGPQRLSIEADGFLEPYREADIYSAIPGRVTESRGGLRGGVSVDAGDVLIALDDRRASLAFESARTEMIRASLQFITAAGLSGDERAAWNGYLSRLGDASPMVLPELPPMEYRQALLAATLGVRGAHDALASAALDLEDHRIRAPFNGVLSGDGITEGAMVSPGVPLARLSEIRNMELAIALPAEDFAHVAVGDLAEIRHPEDESSLSGRVVRVEPALRTGSQTARVYISVELPEDGSWIPGSYVRARIAGKTIDSAFRVPREILINGRLPVMAESRLAFMPVTVIGRDANDILLAADFPDGTEMVETVMQDPIEGLLLSREAE